MIFSEQAECYFQDSATLYFFKVCVTMNHLIFKQCTHFLYPMKCTLPDSTIMRQMSQLPHQNNLMRYNSVEIEADFVIISYNNFMKTPNCFIMRTPNYLDRCLQSCFLVKVTMRLLWNVLWVVHVFSIAQS